MIDERPLPEIVEQASKKLGMPLAPAPNVFLARPGFKKNVADATSAFAIEDADRRRQFVVLLSSPDYPDAVNGAVQRAAAAAARLPQRLARHVLTPVLADRACGRTYAVYARYYPLSSNRGVRALEKRAIENAVYGWLGEVASATQTKIVDLKDVERCFIAPLDFLANESGLSAEVRAAAARVRKQATHRDFAPTMILEHGDLWLGNILFPRRSPLFGGAGDFVIIDWGASNAQGYPLIDLIRFFDSTSSDRQKLRRAIKCYNDESGIAALDPELYALAALGQLGLHRNQFPRDRYLSLAEKCAGLAREARSR